MRGLLIQQTVPSRLSYAALFFSAAIGCSQGGATEDMRSQPPRKDISIWGPDDPVQPPDLGPPPDLTPPSEPDWTLLAGYLDSLFDANSSLMLNVPTPAGNTYWTANSSVLAASAYSYLPTPNKERSDAIFEKLRSFKICGCQESPGHDATINHYIDPVTTKRAVIPATPTDYCPGQPVLVRLATDNCSSSGRSCPGKYVQHADYTPNKWASDSCNQLTYCTTDTIDAWDATGTGKGRGEILALQILSLRNQQSSNANVLWEVLQQKWDGRGINDAQTVSNKYYSVDRLALFKIVARVLNKPLPIEVDAILKAAQGPNGGIRTNYAMDGSFTLDQNGSTSTTSLVVLAYRKPVADF